jgi:hypothetical protein
MWLIVDDPAAIPPLLAALRAADCLAEQTGPRSIELWPLWAAGADDLVQVPIELGFFVRAWEATNAGVRVTLASADDS